MALTIRLQRHGAVHKPMFRMVVTEKSYKRDGRFVEILGNYNPQAKGKDTELDIKLDRVDYWTGMGAQLSDTAKSIVKRVRQSAAAKAQ